MVQSLNTKALLTLASVVRRPSLLVPHVSLENISQLHYQALKDHCHIKAILFDKDNTLTAPYVNAIHPKASWGFAQAVEVFGKDKVAIVSNSAGTLDDVNGTDATEIEAQLEIAVIRHEEKKPGGLQEVLDHFQLEDPAELCMVGDRLLTDVVFGNLYGMLTVHVLPLCVGEENQGDNKIAKVLRSIENKALYGNWFGGRYLLRNQEQQAPPTTTSESVEGSDATATEEKETSPSVFAHKYWPGPDACPLVTSEPNSSTSDEAVATTNAPSSKDAGE